MNQIDKIRAEVKAFFDPTKLKLDSREFIISPNQKYRLATSEYRQNKKGVNWNVTKVEVYDLPLEERIFDFFGNSSRFFFEWLNKDSVDYLICAEDLFGGQTVIDLTHRKMESFSPGEDGFIWTEFYLSPDGNKLATIGCYWACPYEVKIYDFNKPLDLPLKELHGFELLDANEQFVAWLDDETIKLKGMKREIEIEELGDGVLRNKTISEIPMERVVKLV